MSDETPESTERDEETVARLRERLAFYESFDQVIQENIARSGDLLRQAMDVRQSASSEIAAVQTDALRRRSEDQSRYRVLFSVMLDELTELQGQAERLARRMTDALDEIEAELPASGEATIAPGYSLSDEFRELPPLAIEGGPFAPFLGDSDLDPETILRYRGDEPAGAIETAAVVDQPVAAVGDDAAERMLDDARVAFDDPDNEALPAVEPFSFEEAADPRGALPAREAPAATAVAGTDAPPVKRPIVVIVHGVPGAAAALSLKRFLEDQRDIRSVVPREFAEGILRLEIAAARPVTVEELRRWPGGGRMEAVHARDDLVEVRLP